jgi:hypothetical protein
LYTAIGDISSSDNELEALVDDLPGIGTAAEEAWSATIEKGMELQPLTFSCIDPPLR